MTVMLWVGFLIFLAALIALDVGVFTRRPRQISALESALSAFLWIVAAGLIALAMVPLYRYDIFDLATDTGSEEVAGKAWLQFVTAYCTELALSLDNVAVLAVIFAHFHVTLELRPRLLLWVVVASLVMRALLIGLGVELLHIPWMAYVFAGGLLVAAVRELLLPDPGADISRRWLIRLITRLHTSPEQQDQRLVSREGGHWSLMPLMTVFLVAFATDLSFAIDSLPAVLSVTRDPFIAFTSNALAVLALRSLYFALAPLLSRFRFMKLSLTAILLFLAVKMALYDKLPTEATLYVVIAIVVTGVGASVIFERWRRLESRPEPRPAPITDLAEAAAVAQRNFRKVVILIVGTVVILGGIAIAPLPGPGPMVLVPLGLVILATEFVWAKRLLATLKEQTEALAQTGDRVGDRIPKWALIIIELAYYGAFLGLYALVLEHVESRKVHWAVVGACFGLSIPFVTWLFRTARRPRKVETSMSLDSSRQRVDATVPPGNDAPRNPSGE